MSDPNDDFLTLFDPDPVRANQLYGQLWRRLVKYFQCRRCIDPEDLVQETFRRGFGKILTVKLTAEPAHYFMGIAKMVLFEYQRKARQQSRFTSLDEHVTADQEARDLTEQEEPESQDVAYEIPAVTRPFVGSLPDDPEEASRLLQAVLRRRLSAGDAKLVRVYATGTATSRVKLAHRLKLTPIALRVKFHRLVKRMIEEIQRGNG